MTNLRPELCVACGKLSMVTRFQHIGRTLLLSALVLGLNVLGLLAVTHARHPNHVRASVAHGHHGSMRRDSRDRSKADDGQQAQVDHAGQHVARRQHNGAPPVGFAALPSEVSRLFAPEFVDAPLQSVSEIALGSAPRAPGAPRGPPTT